jgi:hypothetical protein
MKMNTNEASIELLGHRLDLVRGVLARPDLSDWALQHWTAVEKNLQRQWDFLISATLNTLRL